jgi:protoheme IX farnesyltransferase
VIGAVIGFFFYVIMYSFLKHVSSYATLIGSISGAMPPVIGYVAAGNRFDSGAILLFVILVLWQMPHFYAIAIYRFEDYLAASIPVLPIKRGMYITKLRSLFYIVVFILATFALAPLGYMGYLYAVIMTLFGGGWLILGLKNFKSQNDKAWARTMFFASLIVIMALCILMIIESYEGQLKALF